MWHVCKLLLKWVILANNLAFKSLAIFKKGRFKGINTFASWMTRCMRKHIADALGVLCDTLKLASSVLWQASLPFPLTGITGKFRFLAFQWLQGYINVSANPFKWYSGFGQGSHCSNLQVWPILTYKFLMTGPLLISCFLLFDNDCSASIFCFLSLQALYCFEMCLCMCVRVCFLIVLPETIFPTRAH